MNIQEIIDIENHNNGEIHLHKEGFFWKAFQQSAYLFTQEVKVFKVSRKMVKTIMRDVVSVGFPQNALEQYFDKNKLTKIEEKHLLIMGYSLQTRNYQQWLNSLPLITENGQTNDRQTINKHDAVMTSLCGFRVETSTPMECIQFVVSLQKMLDGSL
jgi:anaerobic ribonucleoside-triphosphate reductase